MKKNLKFLLFILLPFFAFSQNTIKGTVSDESGDKLPGASIMVKGSKNGTLTDMIGNFSVTLNTDQKEIIVSFLGFKTKTINVENVNKGNLKIVLESTAELLKEVVTIGYGSVQKKDITGSLVSVKLDDANVNQAQGIENLIQGRAAGVVVTAQGFDPSSPVSIQIRGVNSLSGSTEPLYVIDGIVMGGPTEGVREPAPGNNNLTAPQNAMTAINPRDIESIQILKDASSTAIYGSRGSNGVILITTKKGVAGKTKFSYNLMTKVGTVSKEIEVLDTPGYAQYINGVRAVNGVAPLFNIDGNGVVKDLAGVTIDPLNWHDDIYKPSLSYRHRLTMSGGGSEGNTFYIAAGFVKSEGNVPNVFSKSSDFSLNLNNKLNDKLKLATKIAFTNTQNSASKGTEYLGGTNSSMTRQIIGAAPFKEYAPNYFGVAVEDIEAELDGANAWIKDYDDTAVDLRGLGSLNLEYTISKVFKYKALVGFDYRTVTRQVWFGTTLFRGATTNGEAGLSTLERFRYNIDNTLMFNKTFKKNHKIDGTVGVIIDENYSKGSTFTGSNFALKQLRADGISNAQVYQPLIYTESPEALLSFLGRFNYTYKGKINITATVRTDGSSKFSDGNRFATFPAFAAAWQMHKEKFLSGFSKLNELKLRASWGMTGNQGIRPFQTLTQYNATGSPYSNSAGGAIVGYVPSSLANSNLIWETTTQYNAGLDLSFFNKRLTATFEVYHKDATDLLQNLRIAPSSGFSSITANQGSLINRGAEFSLSADIIKTGNLVFNVYGNISKYRNKIARLGMPPALFGTKLYSAYLGNVVASGNTFKTNANILIEGEQAGLFWGYKTDGIINTPEELALASSFNGIAPKLGDVKLVDQDDNKIIDIRDKTIIGNSNPDFTYGFGTNVTYKGLTLNLFFNGVYGRDVANGNLLQENYATGQPANIRKEAFYDAWTPNNINADRPRLGYGLDLVQGTGFTDRIVEDASFLRLSNVTIGYRIPMEIKAISAMDLSFSASNLLLFTKYSGYDPEVNSFSFDSTRLGIDWNSFPNQKSFLLGLNVSF